MITGYRWWFAGRRPEMGWQLRSVTRSVWWDGPHQTAPLAPRLRCPVDCPLWSRLPHAAIRAPCASCICGIHAFRTEGRAWEKPSLVALRDSKDGVRLYPVMGIVRLWGKVVEHEDGFRAEHALVGRLTVPARIRIRHRPPTPQDGIFGFELICFGPLPVRAAAWRCGRDQEVEEEPLYDKSPAYWDPEPEMASALSLAYGVDIDLAGELEIVV